MSNVEYKDLEKQIDHLSEIVNTEIYEQRKYLLGKVLTITDGAISDKEQRKAVKDLINDVFYQGSYWNNLREVFSNFREANGFVQNLDEPTLEMSTNPFVKIKD